ncbi:Nn.00g110070.m01.CDS01 [Neocucurbitaria sp. VM-36]
MSPRYTILSVLMLLVSTFAVPHDEDETTVSPALKTSKVTKTVVVTVTQTSDIASQPPVGSISPHLSATISFRSGFAPPPPPASVRPPPTDNQDPENLASSSTQTRTAPTMICSNPTEACIIDGIAIWPSGTMSIMTPNLTPGLPPISTIKSLIHSSAKVPSSSATASSASPLGPSTSSTTCPHSMSHFGPSKLHSAISLHPTTPTSTVAVPSAPNPPTTPTTPTTNERIQAQNIDIPTTSNPDNATTIDHATPSFQTKVLNDDSSDPVGWAGVDNALKYTKRRRGQENKVTKRRRSFWSRFFVAGAG